MTVTLDWLGCATYRLTVDGLVIFLDTFMDRISSAPPVGLTSDGVIEADYALIGHAHFDHLAGADVIAKRTGAKVIGSHESIRVLRDAGVPEAQLVATQGGDRFQLSDRVSVRAFPSLHSCTWSDTAPPGTPVLGDLGVTTDERLARAVANRAAGGRTRGLGEALQQESEALRARMVSSTSDGGALDYLIETPEGTVFFQDSMGSWSGVLRDIRADVAILAASARANVDGEPIQGAVEDFIAQEVEVLRPRTLFLGDHDNWAGTPDVPDVVDVSPVRERLARVAPSTRLIEVGYLEGTRLF